MRGDEVDAPNGGEANELTRLIVPAAFPGKPCPAPESIESDKLLSSVSGLPPGTTYGSAVTIMLSVSVEATSFLTAIAVVSKFASAADDANELVVTSTLLNVP
jgi:hypothetical protein